MPPATPPSPAAPEPTSEDARASATGMRLLAAGVPLSLLLDLSLPVNSAAIAADEGGSAGWLDR